MLQWLRAAFTRQVNRLLINDEELSHHAQVFVIKDVAVEHIWRVFSSIGIDEGHGQPARTSQFGRTRSRFFL